MALSVPHKVRSFFGGLSATERFLQALRLFFTCSTIAYAIAVLVAPLFSNKPYIARINCAHLDVSAGLYNSLRNSVAQPPAADTGVGFPVDSSLTNSEISILSAYAEEQVSNAPQYIITTLWLWCYGNYNTTMWYANGKKVYKHDYQALVCLQNDNKYVFDYRQELEIIGLLAILSYAYRGSNYVDSKYQKVIDARDRRYKLVPLLVIFVAASQFALLVATIVMYSNRKGENSLRKLPAILLNAVTLVSIASAIASLVGAVVITHLLIQIKSEISRTLGDFGIYLHMGTLWFLLVWLMVGHAVMAMVCWAFPLWCANPEEEEEDEAYWNEDVKPHVLVNDDELELRQLSETLQRKLSVRQLRKKTQSFVVEEEETRELLYNDRTTFDLNHYPRNFYREETYDGFGGRGKPSIVIEEAGETVRREKSLTERTHDRST